MSFTSLKLQTAIKSNPHESRKEWMLWMMERAGKRNNNNAGLQLWQQNNKPIEVYNSKVIEQKYHIYIIIR